MVNQDLLSLLAGMRQSNEVPMDGWGDAGGAYNFFGQPMGTENFPPGMGGSMPMPGNYAQMQPGGTGSFGGGTPQAPAQQGGISYLGDEQLREALKKNPVAAMRYSGGGGLITNRQPAELNAGVLDRLRGRLPFPNPQAQQQPSAGPAQQQPGRPTMMSGAPPPGGTFSPPPAASSMMPGFPAPSRRARTSSPVNQPSPSRAAPRPSRMPVPQLQPQTPEQAFNRQMMQRLRPLPVTAPKQRIPLDPSGALNMPKFPSPSRRVSPQMQSALGHPFLVRLLQALMSRGQGNDYETLTPTATTAHRG